MILVYIWKNNKQQNHSFNYIFLTQKALFHVTYHT